MSSFTTDAVRRLRDATGAPVVECRDALDGTEGDEDAARARLQHLAIERITASVGCSKDLASAGHGRFGWDLARASGEARRLMLEADPAMAAQQRSSWQLAELRAASCCRDLMRVDYEAGAHPGTDAKGVLIADAELDTSGYARNDLRTLGPLIGALAELEALLDDRSGTDLGHAFDHRDRMTSILATIEASQIAEAIELVWLIRGRTPDEVGRSLLDFVAAHACLAKLFALLRRELEDASLSEGV